MYDTFSGSRPRRYLIAAGWIVFLLVVAAGFGMWQHSKNLAVVRSTPVPLAESLPTLTPTPTPVPPTATPTAEPCPSSADQWHLVDFLPDSHLKALSPSCVYDGLYRTLQWEMLTYRGYTGPEAAEALGFPSMPVGPNIESIGGITSFGQPQQIPLVHSLYREDYAMWFVSSDGKPLDVQYMLRGCYRPFDVDGGEKVDWSTGYDVICLVAMDRSSGWTVNEADGAVYTVSVPAARKINLYGYNGSTWIYIGSFKGMTTQIDDENAADLERESFNSRTGWNPGSINVDGIHPHQLPDGWLSSTDPSVLQPYFAKLESEQ